MSPQRLHKSTVVLEIETTVPIDDLHLPSLWRHACEHWLDIYSPLSKTPRDELEMRVVQVLAKSDQAVGESPKRRAP